MVGGKTILSVVCARAGSKGLKNKNVLNFAGKPLIAWAIGASLKSKHIDRTIVSTDGDAIAKAARKAGADVPFVRPADLATDKASVEDVIRHALAWIEHHEQRRYDYVLLLQPTSPLRTTRHIDEAITHYFAKRKGVSDTLVSVTQAPAKMGWLMTADAKGHISFCFDHKGQARRRQTMGPLYLPNGLIYLAPIGIVRKGSFYSPRTLPFVMDAEVSVDIDTKDDFDRALKLFRAQRSR
jgi:CMP-N,N'-diacetyllegionaminic acid synthase